MNHFKIALGVLLVSIAAIPVFAQYSPAQIHTLDSTLTILHQQSMFNGAVLIADHGKVKYKKAFGKVHISTNEPLKTSSAFNLASVSKQFIAMMGMLLEEKGKLD